jgi:hypothetical protein
MQELQDWCERIRRAASEDGLVATLREFCEKSLGAQLARLPDDVPPCEVRGPDGYRVRWRASHSAAPPAIARKGSAT